MAGAVNTVRQHRRLWASLHLTIYPLRHESFKNLTIARQNIQLSLMPLVAAISPSRCAHDKTNTSVMLLLNVGGRVQNVIHVAIEYCFRRLVH